ncbi:hypothetical protein FIBSPDRAFT_1039810 [Athelia psychrophila]|uniref:Uncharacterized protein n=1 Tax=Athelia psychrophila TaxID=1759441 RepID=A0A166RD83_9AGAM|nr:hypothetical protein FIBSPDRAFT_1039810 [Fibularhizoctonia sp. CBS 109695]
MPPPSPGDDPILLSGRPRARNARKGRMVESSPTRGGWGVGRSVRNSSEDPVPAVVEDDDMDETMQLDLDDHGAMEGILAGSIPPTSDSAFEDAPLPLFDLHAAPDDGGWSDSDDEDVNPAWGMGTEGEGEYTGRFRMMKVPTKADPPTSGTRGRMDEWGRPISPFPAAAKRRFSLPSVEEQDADRDEDMHELPVLEDEDIVDAVEDASQEEDWIPEAQETMVVKELEEEEAEDDCISDHSRDDAIEATVQAEEQLEESFDSISSHQEHEGDATENVDDDEATGFEQGVLEPEVASLHHSTATQPISTPSPEVHALTSEPPRTPVRALDESFSFSRELSVEEEEELEEESVDRELSCPPEPGEQQRVEAEETAARKARRRSPSARWESSPLRFPESAEPFPRFDDEFTHEAAAEVDGDSSDDEEEIVGDDVLTITSRDPLVAARAAAILKQHDYDLVPRIVIKNRRMSHLTPEEASRKARRKSVAGAGISKAGSPKARRRATLGGMVGDRVFIPGSPAMTLPQLLMHAEKDLEHVDGAFGTPPRTARAPVAALKTPPPVNSESSLPQPQVEKGEWTKNDWKHLDACFTDERLEVGERLGLDEDALADVDDVQIESVVDKFIEMMGGTTVVASWGSLWDRACLTTRAHALEKKQRAGHYAPPTPGRSSPSGPTRLSEVPNFTPLTRRRPQPPARRPKLPPPTTNAPFNQIDSARPTVHGSLLAPRYSHLLEEAISISHETPQDAVVEADDDKSFMHLEPKSGQTEQESPGMSHRVKGFFYSYLPTLSKTTSAPAKQRRTVPKQPGLPLPPPDVLGKSRGPISTPIRPLVPKPIPPKEQVQLQPAPVMKKSALPRLTKPQRLVNLHPAPAPVINLAPIERNRRSSGGSVKDLVQNFEHLDRQVDQKPSVKRIRSVGECNMPRTGRPTWKP